MKKEYKYYVIGGIMLSVITFLGFKAFAKPKMPVKPAPKRTGSIIIEELGVGEFVLPSELTSRIGTRLRAKASTESSIIYTYLVPTTLLVKGDATQSDGQWYEVFDKKGRSGWVRADVVDVKN